MYDSHIYCKEYHGLKQTIIDILNGDDVTTDIEKLSDHIQQLYDDGEMQATQYDDLMRYIQDMFWYAVNTDIISVSGQKNQLLSFSQNLIQQHFCYNQTNSKIILKKRGRFIGNVISLKKAKKKKEEKFNQSKKKTQTATEKAAKEYPVVLNPLKDGSSIDVDYAEMKPEDKIEYWKKIEKEEEERFKEKYNDVLAAVPVSAGEKMQYFAKIMLRLIPDIFHESNWDARFDACTDFCEFYISGFDPAYSDYIKKNKIFEKEYQYKFGTMKPEKLEEELEDCLGKIIELCPEKKDGKIELLYQAARLFELEEILSGMFYKELLKE